MLKCQVHQPQVTQTLVPWHKPFLSGTGPSVSFPLRPHPKFNHKKRVGVRCFPTTIKAIATSTEKITSVKAIVTVKVAVGGWLSNLGLSGGLDDLTDLFGKSILLELVSSELDPRTGLEKQTIKGYAHRLRQSDDEVKYECDFVVGEDFGEIGAILVENEHHKEMHLKTITLDGLPNGNLTLNCNSWVAPKSDNPEKRIFYTDRGCMHVVLQH